VRANDLIRGPIAASLGFLTDLRRLNVALTRPKHFLFIVGNARTLGLSPVWRDMIKSYKHIKGGYIQIP